MRLFWDIHTDGAGHMDLEDILSWVSNASNCTYNSIYGPLDAALTAGSNLECCWDDARCRNGVWIPH